MPNEKLQCAKCNGEMVQGFVPDFAEGGTFVLGWHPGQPESSFWTRTKAKATEGLPIGAFRCKDCGYLELYAAPGFEAQ
jgi:hypothetical protein